MLNISASETPYITVQVKKNRKDVGVSIMFNMTIPAFWETFSAYKENKNTESVYIPDAAEGLRYSHSHSRGLL